MKDEYAYLHHMLERCERISASISTGRAAFFASQEKQDAVIRNLEVVGEAAKHISAPLRQQMPELDWRRIAGMRDVLIHNYMGVDLQEIWHVASADVPHLREVPPASCPNTD